MTTPIAEATQIDADVVRPRTVKPSLTMTPAPRKPMPVTIPWMTRVTSPAPCVPALNSYCAAATSSAEPKHTSAYVRSPAARPWKLRSMPIAPPASNAATVRAMTSHSFIDPSAMQVCGYEYT